MIVEDTNLMEMGQLGGQFINNTTDYTGKKFGVIYCVAACTFSFLESDNISLNAVGTFPGDLKTITLAAGQSIVGQFSRVKLATGSVIAYNYMRPRTS